MIANVGCAQSESKNAQDSSGLLSQNLAQQTQVDLLDSKDNNDGVEKVLPVQNEDLAEIPAIVEPKRKKTSSLGHVVAAQQKNSMAQHTQDKEAVVIALNEQESERLKDKDTGAHIITQLSDEDSAKLTHQADVNLPDDVDETLAISDTVPLGLDQYIESNTQLALPMQAASSEPQSVNASKTGVQQSDMKTDMEPNHKPNTQEKSKNTTSLKRTSDVKDKKIVELTKKLNGTEKKLDQIVQTLETMSNGLNETNRRLKAYELKNASKTIVDKKTVDKKIVYDPFNGSVWLGVGYLFTDNNLRALVKMPLLNVEVGVSKSLWNITPYTFLYGGLIFGFVNYTRDLHETAYVSKESYYLMHEGFVLGYEQSLGTPYFSLFLEGGPTIQQINFAIREVQTSKMIDSLSTQVFGGSFNAGFNINTNPGQGVTCVIRLGATMFIGQPMKTTLRYNGTKINANPVLFGPTASIVIRK